MLPAPTSAKRHHMHGHHGSVHLDNNNTTATTTTTTTAQRGAAAGKRNASMIFRIEHLIPSSGSSAATPTTTAAILQQGASAVDQREQKRARLQRAGVFVSQFCSKNTQSEAVATHALIAVAPAPEQQQATRTYCTLAERVLCMTPAIMRRIKLAEDNSSYNALFELHGTGGGLGHVRLRLIRDVAAAEEIVAWFGEETTLLMAIPFLTPLNIQGNDRYTCHMCHLTFESPNPLKIHLALACGSLSMDILWIRLHYAVRAAISACPQPPALLGAAQHSPPTTQTAAAASTSSSLSPVAASETAQTHRFSAFKPITPATTAPPLSLAAVAHQRYHNTTSNAASFSYTTTTTTASASSAAAATNVLSFLPSISSLPPGLGLLAPGGGGGGGGGAAGGAATASPLNAAAQIEAIVSNMGASKQGHLCIYCGKVYSRKYGLKIHIRTHTGFKPLQCKYCLRPFGDPSNLNKHVRLHLQAAPSTSAACAGVAGAAATAGAALGNNGGLEGFQCQMCHKTLARRRDLQRHIESRHGSALAAFK